MKYYKIFIIYILILFFNSSFGQKQGPKVGLVLSGGGAKGYAHIGVLKVLEKSGIRIDYISGTSMGATIGGLYASGYSANELDSILKKADFNKIIFNDKERKNIPLFDKTYKEKYILEIPFNNFNFQIPSAISKGQGALDYYTSLLSHVHSISDFSKLPIPFACVSVELSTGKEVVFENGFLPEAIMASGALPGLIEPFSINGVKYIDGGLINNFPAKLLKDKGMDIVIGVDLTQELKDQSEIIDLPELINQINNITISKGVDKQRPYSDITINPKLNGINVTDFNTKDSVVYKGTLEAEKYLELFKNIAKKQGRENYTEQKHIKKIEKFKINKIEIEGQDKFNVSFIKGKIGIKPPKEIVYQDIIEGINTLYSTGIYKTITYKLLDENQNGNHTLKLNVLENENKLFFKFGLHYDDTFKTGLLVNITQKSFIFNNSQLSLDGVFGDYPRYEANIYIDNGVYPSFGFSSKYIRVPINFNGVEEIEYKTEWFNQQFYLQSTLYDKYAFGLGIQHDYINAKTKNLPQNNPQVKLEDSYFISPYSYLRVDTRDNPNYPTQGMKFEAKASYLVASNSENFKPAIIFNSTLNYCISFLKHFTLQTRFSLGTSFDNSSFVYNNSIGGDFNQEFINHEKFYGMKIGEITAKHKFLIYSGIQYNIFKNNYLTLFGNIANLKNNFEDIQYFQYEHSGVGIMYGYDSPAGPITLRYSYSPSDKNNIISVALGYWF